VYVHDLLKISMHWDETKGPMTSTASERITIPDPVPVGDTQAVSTRRAWRVLIVSFLTFTVLVSGAGAGLLSYRTHATRGRTAKVTQIVTGVQASVQKHQQIDRKVLAEGDVLDEGDTVRTPQDTRVRIALFDGTSVELSGGTTMTIERLRSSQYLDRSATIVLQQDTGRVIVGTSTDTGFVRANVAVRTHSGTIEARQPETSFRVLVLPEQDNAPETTSVSVLGGPAVSVTGAGQQVMVNNGQQTTVPIGLTPTAPTVKQRELVANGTFPFDAHDIGKPTTRWHEISPGDNSDGVVQGSAELIPDAVVRGQKTTALHFVRTGGNVDNDQVGLEQLFSFGELDEFDQVTLTADVRVVSQSLSAGGDIGSEYPLIILLRYEDNRGQAQPDKGWGFYMQNDAGNRTNNGTLVGQPQLVPNTWTPFTVDLKMIKPAPYKLVGLQVYASGHDYDAYIANVSIVAK